MTFDIEKKVYGREFIHVVEMDLEFCSLTYSQGACLAGRRILITTAVSVDDFNVGDTISGGTSGAEGLIIDISGSSPTYSIRFRVTNGINFQTAAETINNDTATGVATKNAFAPIVMASDGNECFNTQETTQDITNYDPTTKTYRFCTQRSPHPIAIDAIPNILDVSINPTEIDLGGGLGVRASVTISFKDHPYADSMFDEDPYLDDRNYIAFERGTFWTKFRARNPNYQFRNLRLLSGYLVDGIYDANNFETRHYVIETLNATSGKCTIVAKDPLRLAMPKKALCPTPSTGLLNAGIGTTGGFVLTPAGEGLNYTVGDHVTINSEVMLVLTIVTDTFTVTRGQYNTVAAAHSANDTVQKAYVKNAQVNVIVKDLLENFSNVSTGLIPATAWQSEIDAFLPGLLDGIVTKPIDVNKILRELSQDAPHYLWWDEREQLIQLTALKSPPLTANVIDMDEELIADSVNVKDMPDKRISTVFVHFGMFDPTKQLTETNNYQQTYVRPDTASIDKYENNQTKTIFSRWISNTNKAAALQLAKLIGRRFSDTPRMIEFDLDAKDSDFWAGQNAMVNHRDMVDGTGSPIDTLFQILSTKTNRDIYNYSALEFKYGPTFGDDPPDGIVVYIPTGTIQNLRTLYDGLFPTPISSTDVTFIIANNVICGGIDIVLPAIDTGLWPEITTGTLTLQIDIGGYIVGKGGNGAGDVSGAAAVGGLGMFLNHDLTLINNGIIGGGGGGGGRGVSFGDVAGGGGGAGSNTGVKGIRTLSIIGIATDPEDGGIELGGAGGSTPITFSGAGGDLGQAGAAGDTTSGALAGVAINKNGKVLTEAFVSDIRGSVVA